MANGDVLFQSFPLADWPWGGALGNLYWFDTGQWVDQNGMIHLQNIEESLVDPVQICPILVNGRNAVVQDFYYQPTTLSIDRPNARRTGVLVDQYGDVKYDSLFSGVFFPELPNPMTLAEFIRQNLRGVQRSALQDRYLDAPTIYGLFQDVTTISPADLARLPTARGVAQMAVDLAAGFSQVVVPCALVTANSLIRAWSMDDRVTGALRIAASTVGQDFTVRSNEIGNVGLIGWEVSEPF